MWTVIGKESQVEDGQGHAFLILSRAESTMILQTGKEINELDQSGFFTEGPTIFCGNLGSNKYIIQVMANMVRLLDGSVQLQNLPLDLGSPIVHVSAADPYLVAVTENGQMILLSLDKSSSRMMQKPEISVVKANLKSKSKLVTACAYEDASGLFTTETPEEIEATKEATESIVTNNADIDDEDELLYGESAPSLFEKAATETKSSDADGDKSLSRSWKRFLTTPNPTYWTLVLRENGNLEILSLPDFTVKYLIQSFNLAPNILQDALFSAHLASPKEPENLPKINEITMVGLGDQRRRPLLLARYYTDKDFLLIVAFHLI